MSDLAYKINNQDDFNRGVLISVAIHLAILLVFGIKSVFYAQPDFDYQSAIRVDMVALPDKITPQQMPSTPEKVDNKPEAKAPPVEQVVPEKKMTEKIAPAKPEKVMTKTPKINDAINLDKTSTKEKKAIENLKKLDALEKIKSDVSKEAAQKKLAELAAASKVKPGSAKIKGNMISRGSDLVGIEKLQHDEYRSILDHHIKQRWTLSQWMSEKKFKAQALVKIDSSGHVLTKQIVKTSGNHDFDASVLDTIDRSSPMPAPPQNFISLVSGEGILIEFGE